MKYIAYDTFIDYLFSSDGKEKTYDKLTAWLIKSGDVNSFRPSSGSYSISLSSVQSRAFPYSDFDKSPDSYDCRPSVTSSNSMSSETDKSYQEVFNIPAKDWLSECKYIDSFVQKAIWNDMLNEDLEDDSSSHGSGPRVQSSSVDPAYEALEGDIPFKSQYDEAEYDSYGIPMDFLKGDAPGVISEELLKFYGSKITTPCGCLLGVAKGDQVFPIGYIDFEGVKPSTRVEIKFDPSGFLQLN